MSLYACHPCYSGGVPASHRQFWARSVSPDGPYAKLLSRYDDYGCSLLADCFNTHWAAALNLGGVTRFAMLHDDVVPQDFWLDALLAELDSTGADLVAAVVPVKDTRGLTSTAVDDPDDPWEVHRRLTLAEVHRLPPTFGAADVAAAGLAPRGRALLVNTGCWVCRFDKPWRERVSFRIQSRLAFAASDGRVFAQRPPGAHGKWTNQVMSEDWDFSRQLAAEGARVLATRKVELSHHGSFPFPNREAWGSWQEDAALARKFGGPLRPFWPSAELPDVHGWLSDEEGQALQALARGKRVLEVGSAFGRSTAWLAREASRVFAVDTFDGRGCFAKPRDTRVEFEQNLRKLGVWQRVAVLQMESSTALQGLMRDGYSFDVVFIDGAHDEASARRDATQAVELLAPGGALVLHDYGAEPGVTAVANMLVASKRVRLEDVVGTLAVLRRSDGRS